MNAMVGVVSRQGPKENPLMKRLLESVRARRPGLGMVVQVEVGERATRGEKRQRIFTLAKQQGLRYCCILEDDTEILEDDWLVKLLQPMVFGDIIGMLNPMESKDGMVPVAPQLAGQVIEHVQCFGFCIAYDLSWNPVYDPKITWLDDLAMSLQCRAAGRRVATAGVTMVRHSKEPFLRDDLPPWEQQDRSRWGEGNSYYQQDTFMTERKAEAQLLIAQYGEMARLSLPPELL